MSEKVQGFPTVDGRTVAVRPVDMKFGVQLLRQSIIDRYRHDGAPIDPPTYTITAADGHKETHPHDETSLETDADRAAWAAYQDTTARMEREFEAAFMRYILLGGIVCNDPTPEWMERCAFLGLTLPENGAERKLLYIQMEVLPTPADLKRAIAAILAVIGTGSEEMVRVAEDLFRRAMAESSPTLDTTAGGGVEL